MKKLFTSYLRYGGALALAVFFSVTSAVAQQQVSGTVVDSDDGSTLPGVSIVVKGTSTGTITDINGNYSINANAEDVLVFTFVGYAAQEFTIGNQSTINVEMALDVAELQEVVVTGYSVDSRRETTGSVSTVKARGLQVTPTGNVEQTLQGRVAGVTVITNGQPGTTSKVRVRGFGALSGNQPLYVVDGVPQFNIDWLAPDDIAETTVLKDATSAAVYGARAANGVIVITTKKGKRNSGMQVTYNGQIGFTTPGQGFDNLNPQQQAEWTWNAIRNAAEANGEAPSFNHPQYGTGNEPVLPDFLLVGNDAALSASDVNLSEAAELSNADFDAGPIHLTIRANKSGTDWYDELTSTALVSRHNIGLSGGGEMNRYYIGLNAQQQEGVVQNQRFDRFTFRANSEFDVVKDKVRIGENIQTTYRGVRSLLGGGGGAGSSDDENIINMAARMPTVIPVRDEFGNFAGTIAPGFNNPENPIATQFGRRNDRFFTVEAFGNTYLEVEPIENLIARTSFGGRYVNGNNKFFTRRTYENSENNSSFGFGQSHFFSTDWVWTNTLKYKRDFGKHGFDALFGQELLNTGKFRDSNVTGIDPFSTDPDFVNINTINSQVATGSTDNGTNFSSVFGRLKYNYADKYLFTFLVRRDGTSVLGEDVRFGVFPALSAAWRISDEAFMDGLTWIDDLKIRGGWGEVGNVNGVAGANQFTSFGTSIFESTYNINGSNSGATQGFFQNRLGNPNAIWETNKTINVGLDALFLDGKLDVIVDFWKRTTEDMLLVQPISVQNGPQAAAPSTNVGSMENKGVDLRVVYKGNAGDLRYEIAVNGGFLDNEVVAFGPGIDNIVGPINIRGIEPVRNEVGQPLSSFFGFVVEGLFQDAADVASHATQEGAARGRFKFKDINGDGEITVDGDRTNIGNPIPDFSGGLTINLKWKNFEFEAYGFAQLGNEIYHANRLFTDFYPLFPGAASNVRVLDSWTPENTGAEIPVFENISNFSTIGQSNSFFVEDGGYFRMQNITLSYNLPGNVLENLGLNRLRLSFSTNNVFTITDYEGLDPSVGGEADTNFGVDVGNVPITRSFLLGINATF